MRKALAAAIVIACLGVISPAAAISAEDADTACAAWHVDPATEYTGPVPIGIECEHLWAPIVSWTVPEEVTTARFYVSAPQIQNVKPPAGWWRQRLT